ncbi:MAG: GNAT family N-acetyltransferase [Tannerella sp.]|jgi:putative acetyltransferase|nr:GNAT family N-acetyltransferase [Tannerella sp.]
MNIIETERLILRPIVESDTEDLFEYCKNPNVGINAGWKPHDSMEETREIMKLVFLDQENAYGMVLKETGKLFGSIGMIPDPKRQYDKTRMIGYAISEDYWGKGYTSEAVKALLRYGFEELNLELISAYCFSYNEKSKKVLINCGFEYEGRLRLGEKRFDGTILDHECYSIMRRAEL